MTIFESGAMRNHLTSNRNLGLVIGALLMTTACSSNPLSEINPFGNKDNDIVEENVAPEDDRKPVLALESELKADDALAGKEVQLPPPYVNAAWTQPGGDADHTMHHLGASLSLDRLWTAKVTKDASKRSPLVAPPIVADGSIFVVDSKATISAYDINSGQRKWRVDMTPEMSEPNKKWYKVFEKSNPAQSGFGGGVAYDSGRVFVTSGFGFVAALDGQTGELVWQHETTAPVRTPPTAVNGSVYVITNSNEFFALDQASGEQQWDYQSFEENARFLSATSAAANDDVVIAPFSSGEVTALKADNGQLLWTETVARSSRMTALSNLNDIAGSPVIDRGIVFAISHAGQMSAIDLRSGQTIWESAISGLRYTGLQRQKLHA